MPDISIVSVYPQTFLKVGTLYHGTDGAAEAHGSEGSCPRLSCSLWYLDNQIRQAPELLWFPKLSQERKEPQAAAESEGGYQVARESHRRREKDRNGEREKHPLQSGLFSELNDQRWLKRGTDEVRSLET